MRVLQINSVCGVGSTGRIATDIDKTLKSNGHESYIAYGRGSAINCDTTIKIGNNYDNYAHVAKTRLTDKHGLGSVRATREFIAKIEALNLSVIHLHNIHGYYMNIELLFEYLKRANKPVVWTLHDCWAFTGHCSYFNFVNCDRWKTGCYSCPQKSSYPSSIFIDNSISNYELKRKTFTGIDNLTLITPSKWLSRLVEQSFLKEYPVNVINNGIDITVFKPTKSNFRVKYNLENKFVILGVASVWEQRKGYEYFLELSKKLKSDEIIIMVGLTEKQKQTLPINIIGITKTNNTKELAEIYSAADIFFNPTLEDNFPTTNLESLACGTPVITFNTGGSVESIDEESGFVIDNRDIDAVLSKGRIVKERGKTKYSQHCINRAISNYDSRQRFNEYVRLYSLVFKKVSLLND